MADKRDEIVREKLAELGAVPLKQFNQQMGNTRFQMTLYGCKGRTIIAYRIDDGQSVSYEFYTPAVDSIKFSDTFDALHAYVNGEEATV